MFLQCRDCSHSVCEVCETKEDGLDEEWRVCCQCEKIGERRTEDCLGPELNAPICQEGTDGDSDDILHSSGGVDLGFPEWLVGGRELEAFATRVPPMQQHGITRLGEQTN